MASARAFTSEDISAKAPTTGKSTLEPHDPVSLVMGPVAPSGVPRMRPILRASYPSAMSITVVPTCDLTIFSYGVLSLKAARTPKTKCSR